MRQRAIVMGAGLAMLVLCLAVTAEARNPNCAGGIQYVTQGLRDKEKGNIEDYKREMLKAVDRLTQCSSEDPEDLEALGYLGYALAEIDSAGPAGVAFDKAITGMKAKGDKKVDQVASWREHYWSLSFNEGIADIQAAQATYPEFTKEPADDAEKALKSEATNKYDAALRALTRASLLRPGDPRTFRNLGTAYALMGDFKKAESTFREGIKAAPGDSDLASALVLTRKNYANKLLDDKKFDEAIGFYVDLAKTTPGDADLHLGLADAYFKRAIARTDTTRRADYLAAGDEYAAAAKLKPTESDLLFNSALAYQNAGLYEQSVKEWQEFLKLKPDETDALAPLGSALAELKRYNEAAAVLHKAVMLKPKDKILHRQLGGVYARAENQPKSYEEMVVYIALERGTAADNAADAAKKAPAASEAGKVLAAGGPPDELRYWEAEGQKYETWLYWTKNLAYTFSSGGKQVARSDWGAAPPDLQKAAAPVPGRAVGKKK